MVGAPLAGLAYRVSRSTSAGFDFYEELGRRIADLRKSRSMSQERLGEAAEVGVSYVAHIEVGSRRPTLEVLLRLADALQVPLWRLITDDRLDHDELLWDAAARDLGTKVRGLSHDDLRVLAYLADRLHGATSAIYPARAAEARAPRRQLGAGQGATRKRRP